MLKFLLGAALGVVLAVVFVRFNWEPPAVLDLPDTVKKDVVSAAIEGDLYDLDNDEATRTRALEVYFKTRAGTAAKLDAAAGHPFLAALYRERATREARILAQTWTAFDKVLAEPALKATLERKHAVSEPGALKRAMLFAALQKKPFLKTWLARNLEPPTADNLRDLLTRAASRTP